VGVSNVKPTADVPMTTPTETEAPARPKPGTLAQDALVEDVHIVVMQLVTPIAIEVVVSAKMKFSPEIVNVFPPLVAMFRKLFQVTAGESNVKDLRRVPTTSKTVTVTGDVCGYPVYKELAPGTH